MQTNRQYGAGCDTCCWNPCQLVVRSTTLIQKEIETLWGLGGQGFQEGKGKFGLLHNKPFIQDTVFLSLSEHFILLHLVQISPSILT